ncbi:hypothetical protein EVAR_6343_1 [Eumeta japonica]|uniref:Uncharacterized protein n=1 Tax=Eumeta variegata TaxID=151549 RepID=A0A4C1TBW3_EUMVA|nr:hypothetical protein EVAR_6343_1 [Eumeta japonica]
MKRRPFALQMADDLMKPWLQERYQTVTLQRNLKLIIAEILKINDPQEGPSHDVPKTRKICNICPAKKRRMTTTFCKGVQNTDLQGACGIDVQFVFRIVIYKTYYLVSLKDKGPQWNCMSRRTRNWVKCAPRAVSTPAPPGGAFTSAPRPRPLRTYMLDDGNTKVDKC